MFFVKTNKQVTDVCFLKPLLSNLYNIIMYVHMAKSLNVIKAHYTELNVRQFTVNSTRETHVMQQFLGVHCPKNTLLLPDPFPSLREWGLGVDQE